MRASESVELLPGAGLPSESASELTDRGRDIRGIYLPVGMVRSWKPKKLITHVRGTGADAVIIDVKDDMGRVVFRDDLPHATGRPHGYHRHMAELVREFHAHDIYVIGRLVCFKDNLLPGLRRETAIQDSLTGGPWKDRNGKKWIDPYSPLARTYLTSVAVAAEALGVDEIQLDYVRFPVEPGTRQARYGNRRAGLPRYQAIADLLEQVDEAIRIPLSIDVFGLTAYHPEESEALGQRLEYLASHVDVISPMVYLANWPRDYWENPSAERTHAVIRGAVKKIRERLGDRVVVRPLLQAFKWRSHDWGDGFIINQIDAARDAGSGGHLFWNAGGNYDVVGNVWNAMNDAGTESDKLSLR